MPGLTRVRNRDTGAIVVERVFGGNTLNTLYEGRLARLLTNQILSRRLPSSLYGWLQRRPATRHKIPDFVQTLGVDPAEAELPLEEYRSLNDFFTRRLKPEARPIDPNPAHLISPADGRVLVYP